jgi:hypothetical protein
MWEEEDRIYLRNINIPSLLKNKYESSKINNTYDISEMFTGLCFPRGKS